MMTLSSVFELSSVSTSMFLAILLFLLAYIFNCNYKSACSIIVLAAFFLTTTYCKLFLASSNPSSTKVIIDDISLCEIVSFLVSYRSYLKSSMDDKLELSFESNILSIVYNSASLGSLINDV